MYETGHIRNYLKDGKEVVKTEIENFVFVQIENSKTGYYYDLHNHKHVQRIDKDSFFKYEWYAQIKLYSVFLESDFILLSSKKGKDNLEEVYSLKGKNEDTVKTGIIRLRYEKTREKEKFSLSRELDSLKGMRLSQVRIVNNPIEFKDYGVKLPEIERSYLLKKNRCHPR